MKKQFLYYAFSLSLLALVWSCDNGNADTTLIDGAPTIEIGEVTGTVTGEDFSVAVTLSDGVDGSTISSLATLTYTITGGGATVASGTENLTGDNQTITISVAGGFAIGDYNLDLTVTDTNGNANSDNISFTVELPLPDFDISGDWTLEPVAGALKVGPAQGSNAWWQNGEGDVTARACLFDDVYTFTGNATGTFGVERGDATWLEPWQGSDPEACGAPVAPFVSSTAFTYNYQNNQLTLEGVGAALGLVKAFNGGELGNVADAPDQVTYEIASQTVDGPVRRMTLQIFAGGETWWEFLLISGTPDAEPINVVGDWTLEPVAGALGVGPGQGDVAWWSNADADVTTRACLFDDVYTFAANGDFSMALGSETWLESWQGTDPEACGTPVAPHDGTGSFTYELSGSNLKLIGSGAHVGVAKAINGEELPNVAVPADVTYIVSDFSDDGTNRRMTVQIKVGGDGWWQFKLISQ